MKIKDHSPVCLKPQTAQKLIERGWGKIQIDLTNQSSSNKEAIRIIQENMFTTGIYKNGTITEANTIEILFDNFKLTGSPLIIKIFNPNGETYKIDNIPSSNIQPDGFYKYQIYLKGNTSTMGEYRVLVTHDNATAWTSAYLSNAVP